MQAAAFDSLSREELIDLLAKERNTVRLNMVYQVAKGLSSREVAKVYGISFKQVINWVHRFEESGIEGLYDMPGRGRKSILSMVDLEKIREVVLTERPENLGYNKKDGQAHYYWSG